MSTPVPSRINGLQPRDLSALVDEIERDLRASSPSPRSQSPEPAVAHESGMSPAALIGCAAAIGIVVAVIYRIPGL